MKPIRIQRKRVKGWRTPKNTVYVGRPTKWGNPFIVGSSYIGTESLTLKQSLKLYKKYIKFAVRHGDLNLNELKGKNLSCFCSLDKKCHADILLALVNKW